MFLRELTKRVMSLLVDRQFQQGFIRGLLRGPKGTDRAAQRVTR